jgi:hypothetical protein
MEDAQERPGEDGGIGCVEQGSTEAGIPVCGVNHLLCTHASHRNGQRSSRLVPPLCGIEQVASAVEMENAMRANTEMDSPNIPKLTDGVVFLRPLCAEDAAEHLAGEDDEMAKWLSGGRSTLANVQKIVRASN